MSEIIQSNSDVYVYVIHCIDDSSCEMINNGTRFGGSTKRMSVYAEHKAWQADTSDLNSVNYIKKIAAGPLESDDGRYMIGSMFIVESTREAAQRFIHNDPFYANSVWSQITISRWVSIPNGIKPMRIEKIGDDMSTIRMVSL